MNLIIRAEICSNESALSTKWCRDQGRNFFVLVNSKRAVPFPVSYTNLKDPLFESVQAYDL
jgi:hypothetical protein